MHSVHHAVILGPRLDDSASISESPRSVNIASLSEARFIGPKSLFVVDGGQNAYSRFIQFCPGPWKTTLWLGDGDSGKPIPGVVSQPKPTQDESDFEFTLRHLLQETTHVRAYGFLSGRKDHEWMNVMTAYRFLQSNRSVCRFDFDPHHTPSILLLGSGSHRVSLRGTFSILSLVENSLTVTGAVDYPLAVATPLSPFSTLGLSNQTHQDQPESVELTCREPLIIFCEGVFPK